MIVEIVEFQLKDGVPEDAFVKAFDDSHEYFGAREGYHARKLIKRDEHVWADLLHWETIELAHAAAKASNESEIVKTLNDMIDFDTVNTKRYEVVKNY